jgi:hypothetical protein
MTGEALARVAHRTHDGVLAWVLGEPLAPAPSREAARRAADRILVDMGVTLLRVQPLPPWARSDSTEPWMRPTSRRWPWASVSDAWAARVVGCRLWVRSLDGVRVHRSEVECEADALLWADRVLRREGWGA